MRLRNDIRGENSKIELVHSYCRAVKSCACTTTLQQNATS